ncbi:hypothetical protein [Streptacidiphilus albus]|uniref:hypothetical protein n=1 Tax=Streptacidiphilus albus TaxID=105425 RepID=UPI00054B0D5B|nr:hypothetical protein [Streptacidiphilus albus]
MRKQGLIFQLIVIACTVVCIAGGVTVSQTPVGFLLGTAVGVLLNLLIKAALPARLLPGLNGAQLSAGQRQGPLQRLVVAAKVGRPATPEGDLAELAQGRSVFVRAYRKVEQGGQLCSLVLTPGADGRIDVSRTGTRSRMEILPIHGPYQVRDAAGDTVTNPVALRFGYREPVLLKSGSAKQVFWLRPTDAALLRLAFPATTSGARIAK